MTSRNGAAAAPGPLSVDVVVPTVGRPSLAPLLLALDAGSAGPVGRVLVVDDRPREAGPLALPALQGALAGRVSVVRGPGRGPAAARNVGLAESSADWVAFLDDDVLPRAGWAEALGRDLAALADDVAGSQGRVRVALEPGRRPTDRERGTKALERARWATADMAYRRGVLQEVGGFDERFPRAFREDADLALRVLDAGHRLEQGARVVDHPVRREPRWASLAAQAGNADDALMRRLHGEGWQERVDAARGRRRVHLATTAAGALSLAAALAGRRRLAGAAGASWALLTADFAVRRMAAGPATADELTTMATTSVLIPPLAAGHWLRGLVRAERLVRASGPRPRSPRAVLFDRDATLIVDVPYNGDPALVEPMPGARAALDRLRRRGVPVAAVSNQSGVARGLISEEQVRAVNRRVDELLGPLDAWFYCPHGPDDGCDCRKPRPGMVLAAARRFGVEPAECALIGDIGADVQAAAAAGARGILVPTAATRAEEIEAAAEVAGTIEEAVDRLLGGHVAASRSAVA